MSGPARGTTWRDRAVGTLAIVLFHGFGCLPLDWASTAGGWIARMVGPHLGISRVGRRNLRRAFPDKSEGEIEAILRGVWDNLGRVVGEFPHLDAFDPTRADGRVVIEGGEHLARLRGAGPALLISGHLANWEVFARSASLSGIPLHLVYRHANNPLVERLYRKARGTDGTRLIAKGPGSARQLVEVLRQGGHVGMLIDQKMNNGIAVPFFGRDAMTAPAVAFFARRHNCPVLPARIERLGGAHFRIVVEAPLEPPADAGEAATLAFMTRLNGILERWIRERPEQWLWLHRRWPQ